MRKLLLKALIFAVTLAVLLSSLPLAIFGAWDKEETTTDGTEEYIEEQKQLQQV